MSRYHFYDLETSGLSPVFAQILQFALVETDEHFVEISRQNIRVKLSNDQIPHPKALLVNHTHPSQFQNGEGEYEAIKKIHNIVNTPKTINVGYNTLNFDDEFLRFSFFKHLLPSYTHQWANGCSRLDIFPIVLLAYRLRPGLLNWPEVNGKVSFKLEHLARANGINSGDAHDALVDVLDTIGLARILKSDETFWNMAVAHFDKKKDEQSIDTCPSQCPIADVFQAYGFMLESFPGTPFVPVLNLGCHPIYKNQTRWLKLDNIGFQDFSSTDELLKKIEVIRKKAGEPPFFFSFQEASGFAIQCDAKADLIQQNLNFLSQNPRVFILIQKHCLNQNHPDRGICDESAMLYKISFPTNFEEIVFQQFHLINSDRKMEMLFAFPNRTHRELAIRLVGQNMPELLPSEQKLEYDSYLERVFTAVPDNALQDHQGHKKLTLIEALAETQKLLLETPDPESQAFLQVLKAWYEAKRAEFSPKARLSQAAVVSLFGASVQEASQNPGSFQAPQFR